MNERIKLLAELSGLRFTQLMSNPMVPVVDGKETDLEKFAELIAAECISVVTKLSPNYPLRYKNGIQIEIYYRDQIEEIFRGECVEEIKQHFGVEE